MVNQLSFSQQAREFSMDASTQRFLMLTDMTRYLRDVGKLGSIVGTVSAAAGAVLGYNSKPLLKVATLSAFTWCACRQLYQTLEPQALSIIDNYRRINTSDQSESSFESWFNKELQQLHENLLEEKATWIVINNQTLKEKFKLNYNKEDFKKFLRSIVNEKNKDLVFSLTTIGNATEWICIIYPGESHPIWFKTTSC